jgi:hypothetical protein
MDTAYFVSAKQLEKNFSIKDTFILKQVINEVDTYRTKLNELGSKFDYLDVWSLAEKLNEKEEIKPENIKPEEINVIAFGKTRITESKELKRDSSAGNMTTVVNSLVDYFRSDFVPITAITAKMLAKYEAFLRKPRVLQRLN